MSTRTRHETATTEEYSLHVDQRIRGRVYSHTFFGWITELSRDRHGGVVVKARDTRGHERALHLAHSEHKVVPLEEESP